jgi:predicted  nucleic acid-binding Zn-ribbon protein
VVEGDTLLAVADELVRRDDEVAATLRTVSELSHRAGEIRARSAEVRALLDAAPGELAEIDRQAAAARDALAVSEEAFEGAEQRLREIDARRARDDEQAVAERELKAAQELVADSAATARRVANEREELTGSTAAARIEAAGLVEEARRVAEELQAVPRISQSGRQTPSDDLERLDEWASRVHASLLVVRGQLEGERDRLVREANELGSAVLGEQVAGSSVALVRRRLEEALDA